jgi:hypothetical protein
MESSCLVGVKLNPTRNQDVLGQVVAVPQCSPKQKPRWFPLLWRVDLRREVRQFAEESEMRSPESVSRVRLRSLIPPTLEELPKSTLQLEGLVDMT